MRIAITGASGFIGQNLVRAFAGEGHDLILFGRNTDKLKKKFPNQNCRDYTQLPHAFSGVEVVLHLAAALPSQDISAEQFTESNVKLTESVALAAQGAGANLLINYASLGWNDTAYSKSKKKAEEILSELSGLKVATLRLPAVYSDEFRGRLSVLNKVPFFFRLAVFQLLAALRPTVRIDRVIMATNDALGDAQLSERIVSDQQYGNWVYATFKKAVDFGFAFAVIFLFWWLMAIIYLAVRWDSAGPGIFAQKRIGKDNKPFTCYKFRTMQTGTKSAGTHEVEASAVTRVGAFLRRTKLDELPQVVNILRGDVGLVGPRPCLPVQEELIEARENRGVNAAIPGITGYAQVNGIDMSDPQKLAQTDAEYLALRSILMDLKIIVATFIGRGGGDRVKD